MTADIIIQKLISIGYQVRTDGRDILLKADRDPDPVLVTPLLAELRQCKAEAVCLLQGRRAEWPIEVKNLIDQFLISPIPEAPFQLNSCVKVINTDLFYDALRQDIKAGLRGPRARTGALQCDLIDLKRTLQ